MRLVTALWQRPFIAVGTHEELLFFRSEIRACALSALGTQARETAGSSTTCCCLNASCRLEERSRLQLGSARAPSLPLSGGGARGIIARAFFRKSHSWRAADCESLLSPFLLFAFPLSQRSLFFYGGGSPREKTLSERRQP